MTESLHGTIVGIDLGTTNSVVAAIIDGKPTALVEDGESLLPSVVGFKADGNLVTGIVARNQLAAFPDRTVASIKRRMGTMDPVSMGDQSFTPPEISAMILRRLRDRASRVLGESVTRAVITVPAFFDENQRQATREAGTLAGLTVERIINEPTAATLVYHAGNQDRQHIVVYDFGGGTFDVSVVCMEGGVVEVLSSKGDTQLGGDDLDAVLMKFVAEKFEETHGVDLLADDTVRYRLLQACEQAKCRLSDEESVTIAEEFIATKDGQPLNLQMTITREKFQSLIRPFVDRTIECLDAALRDVKMTTDQIDDLVLVGGSTRIPLVAQRLHAEFQREPSRAVDPDLAVALGAATQGAMLSGQSVGPVLVDVTTHTLGVEALVDISPMMPDVLQFSPVIPRNSPLPATYEEEFFTMHDSQKCVSIVVLQGEHDDPERDQEIGEFELEVKTGGDHSKIVVRFDLNLDGTLTATATQPTTGKSKELVIDNALSKFQSEDRDRAQSRLGAMFDASEELLDDADMPSAREWTTDVGDDASDVDLNEWPEAAEVLNQVREVNADIPAEDADEIRELRERLMEAMRQKNEADVKSVCGELKDVLFYVK